MITRDYVLAAISFVLAFTLHELAHGYVALQLGDDTAKREGRLSFNPIRHIDPFGTVILPILLYLTVGFVFGWGKPVPVSAWKFRRPRQGMAIVAAAGPATNFVLAWLSAVAMHATAALSGQLGNVADEALMTFFILNLGFGLFNLLPVPPLDGGRIVVGLLPESLAIAWSRLERAGIVIVILVVILLPRLLASFGIAWDPVGDLFGRVLPWASSLVYRAAGWDA